VDWALRIGNMAVLSGSQILSAVQGVMPVLGAN